MPNTIRQFVLNVKDKLSDDDAPTGCDTLSMSRTEYRRDFQRRLVELRGTKTQEAFARELGIPVDSYRKYETRSEFPMDRIGRLAEITGRSVNYIMFGDDTDGPSFMRRHNVPMSQGGDPADATVVVGDPTEPRCSCGGHSTSIPEIDIRAGMGGGGIAGVHYVPDGNGGMAAADDVCGDWVLPEYYIRSELRVSAAVARIVEVQGDSMEPTLHSGDRVMVNMADVRPSPPGIFALWDGYGIVVKRIEHIPNSDPPVLRISSDNALHREYERTADEVKIVGRIVWAARRL